MDVRERRFNLIVGSPGAGKSTYIANVVDRYTNGNVLVWKHLANYDDPAFKRLPIKTETNWRQGVQPGAYVKFKMIGDERAYPELLKWLYGTDPNKFKNGLLVIDDCTLFEKDRLSETMYRLVTMRRHAGYRLDIWLVYHGLTNLPIDQFTFVNNIVMFNTTDNMRYKSSRIPLAEIIQGVNEARSNFRTKDKRYTPAIIRLN